MLRRFTLLAIVLVVGLAGCGDDTVTSPWGDFDEDTSEDGEDSSTDVSLQGLFVTFLSPSPGTTLIVKGTWPISVKVEDQTGGKVNVSFDFMPTGTAEPVVREVTGVETINLDIDTIPVPDSTGIVLKVTASTEDGRTASAQTTVVIDNNPPKIAPISPPTPLDGSNFMDSLQVQFSVKDVGTGVTQIVVDSEDYQYLWEPAGDIGSVAEVTTEILEIPTLAWTGGTKQVRIRAYDGVKDHVGEMILDLNFVESPNFAGGERATFPDEVSAMAITGVRLGLASDGIWALGATGTKGTNLYERDSATHKIKKIGTVGDLGGVQMKTADMNLDGYDDLVVVGRKTATEPATVNVYFQTPEQTFLEPVKAGVAYNIINFDVGDLNGDVYPDIAVVTEDTENAVSISLSEEIASGEIIWGAFNSYGGAQQPEMIGVGNFAGNGRNAVLVGKRTSGIVTVFPMDDYGFPSGGVNSTLENDGELVGLSALATANFTDQNASPNTAIFGETDKTLVFSARAESTGGQAKVKVGDWHTSGLQPSKMFAGLLDPDSVVDVVALCKGANMVMIFWGSRFASNPGADVLVEGPSLLSGPAMDLTMADINWDGAKDIIVLDSKGTEVVTILQDPETGLFNGAYQSRVDVIPQSIGGGKFTKPLLGGAATYKDIAVLGQSDDGKNEVSVMAADSVTGMPLTQTVPNVEILLSSPTKLVAAHLDEIDQDSGPTDVVIATMGVGPAVGDRPNTAMVLLFKEDAVLSTKIVTTPKGFDAGDQPRVVTSKDLDRGLGGGPTGANDLVFIARYVTADQTVQRIQPYFGDLEGNFSMVNPAGQTILGEKIINAKNPVYILAYPLRLTLASYMKGFSKDPDLITANNGTGDFTVFPAKSLGVYYSEDKVKDFAVGRGPQVISAGYMEHPIDGTASLTEAEYVLPDVVTLLANDVVVSFSSDNVSEVAVAPEKISFETPQALGHAEDGPIDMALADVNCDGYLDIIVLNQAASTVTVYVNLSQRRFSEPYSYPTGVGPVELEIIDLNGDGGLDIVTADRGGKTLTTIKNLNICQ